MFSICFFLKSHISAPGDTNSSIFSVSTVRPIDTAKTTVQYMSLNFDQQLDSYDHSSASSVQVVCILR